jgi:transporter family-2 protein
MSPSVRLALVGAMAALLAGVAIASQSTFNSVLEKRLGVFGLILWVHLVGFAVSVPLVVLFEPHFFQNLGQLRSLPFYIPLAGVLGLIIVPGVAVAINRTNPAIAFSLTMVGQFAFALIVQHFGLLEVTREPVRWTQVAALGLIMAGIGLFFSNR